MAETQGPIEDTITQAQIDQRNGEASPNRRKVIILGAVGVAAITSCLVYGGFQLQKQQAAEEQDGRDGVVVAKHDGLKLDPSTILVGGDTGRATLDLGGCMIGGVAFDVVRGPGGKVSDVKNYEIDGIAYPPVTTNNRQQVVVDGAPITIRFQNAGDFKTDFGPNPCATLAHSALMLGYDTQTGS
ncbi:MAG TPA: hypothetical protein VLF60_04450 [Candidatus Saccharimonadales bacterium]|nr:hypothetical protein [Candidatus Saccharimonadales bacterium]